MNIYSVSSVTAFLFCLLLAIFVYPKRYPQPIRKTFAIVTFLICIWTLFPFLMAIAKDNEQALFYARVLYIAACLVPSTFFHFMLYAMGLSQKKSERAILYGSYFASLVFLYFIGSPLFLKGVIRFKPCFGIEPGPIYLFFILYFGFMYTWATVKLVGIYKRSSGYERNRLKYVGLAFALAFPAGLMHFGVAYGIPEFFPHDILIITYSLIITYAILKHRLMNINIALTRASVLAIVYAFVFGIPLYIGYKLLGFGLWIIPFLIAVILATVGPFIYLSLRERTEKRFFKAQHRYQEVLITASKGITRERDIDRLLKLIVYLLNKTLKVSHSSIYLLDRTTKQYNLQAIRGENQEKIEIRLGAGTLLIDSILKRKSPLVYDELKKEHQQTHYHLLEKILYQMQTINAQVVVPSFIEQELIGFLVLGNKVSGEIYTQEDLDILSTLANQSALAIENAQFLKREKENERLIATGQMAEAMSHELGNLMHGLSLWSTVLTSKKFEDEKVKKAIDVFVKNTDDAAQIIDAITEYKNKAQADEKQDYDISAVVQEALQSQQDLIKQRQIGITLKIQENLPKIQGNQNLSDAFKYLVMGAVDAMQANKEKELAIEANLQTENSHIQLRFTDTGGDYTKDALGEDVYGELLPERGTIGGIYYFIARRIVLDHKGAFQIKSHKGTGTTFEIQLPVKVA